MKTVFKKILDREELDTLMREIISDIPKEPAMEMAYPDVFHPSFLLLNFDVRDDSRTIAAFKNRQLVALSSFILSRQTFLPPSFLNRIFFIVRREKTRQIEDQMIKKVESAYLGSKVPAVSYIRANPIAKLSPTGRKLRRHGYKKRFSMLRMARTLEKIPKVDTELTPTLRRVKWEKQDLTLFLETWAKGFGWPAKYIEPAANGMTKRFLERNPVDPNTWINFLAEIDGQPVGTAAFLTFPKTAYVVNVSTLKRYRKRGIATRTMINLMKWCKTRGIKYMALDVEPNETAPVNLYRKLGFTEFGKSAGYVKKFDVASTL